MNKLKLFFKRLRTLETDNDIFWRVVKEKEIEVRKIPIKSKYNGKSKFKKAPKVKTLK